MMGSGENFSVGVKKRFFGKKSVDAENGVCLTEEIIVFLWRMRMVGG